MFLINNDKLGRYGLMYFILNNEKIMMNPKIIYAVLISSSETPIGHFLNGIYYEPFGSDKKLGHLNSDDNFVYYVNSFPNTTEQIHGRVEGEVLVRKFDNQIFQIRPV